MKLILLRHGESQWNLENRFTGWRDVSLTKKGIEEATFSGEQLIKANIKISSVYTSLLNRAIETTDIVADIISFPKKNIQYDWRLNERHYGIVLLTQLKKAPSCYLSCSNLLHLNMLSKVSDGLLNCECAKTPDKKSALKDT